MTDDSPEGLVNCRADDFWEIRSENSSLVAVINGNRSKLDDIR